MPGLYAWLVCSRRQAYSGTSRPGCLIQGEGDPQRVASAVGNEVPTTEVPMQQEGSAVSEPFL